jgi:GT2 family glycosyltransferase
MKLSVLICTRNRAKSLAATLERFFAQRFAGDYEYELLIVDNASTDETKKVAERFASRVRYLFENRPGLSRARNAAIKAAQGEILVFTDDDVLVAENWLDEIHREFSSDLSLSVLGGRVLLAREGLQEVAVFTLNERREIVFPNGGGVAMGANMAFRREVFDRVGLFDVRLGAGTFFAGGEDIELFYRALKAGYKFVYAPNVLVYHDHDRETSQQACRLIYGYGKAYPAYILKHALLGDRYAMRMVYWLLRELPSRWRRRPEDTAETLQRRRAQIRGTFVGLLTAPLPMLFGKES